MPANDHIAYRNVLLIRFSAIGDVAMTLPILHSLAKAYPDRNFTMLTSYRFAPFFSGLPDNVSLLYVDLKRDYHGRGAIKRLYKELSCKGFDAVADLHGVLRTLALGSLFKLHGIPVKRIRKERISRYRLTRLHFKDLTPRPTSIQRYLHVVERLGFKFDLNFSSIFPDGKADFNSIGPVTGAKESPWIGIAPFAAHKGKIYPVELMEKVVAAIDASGPCRQFVFAYGDERYRVCEWESRYKSVSIIDLRLGFRGELALISHLDVMLSMDSANMHLASLTGTPVVSVWGATHPAAGFLGYGQKLSDCLHLDLPCRPCSIYGKKRCRYGDWHCLTDIDPDLISSKVLTYLGRRP